MKSILLGTAALAITASVAFAGSHSVVRMGTEGAYPPYNFLNDAGEIDGFERINETLGRAVGDAVLKVAAQRVQR